MQTYKNSEGYSDPTAGQAMANIKKDYEMERMDVISEMVPMIKRMASLLGFEIVGRIVFRDNKTGKLFR